MTALTVNDQLREVTADPAMPLLYVLRDDLGLVGAKFGCGLGQCGACTVLLDGQPVFSCVTPLLAVEGRRVRTIEGLGTRDDPGPLQRAFIAEQAAQCGYCILGMVMRAQALLERDPTPSEADLRAHMQPNLCRCGTHMRILRAIRRAGVEMAGHKQAATSGKRAASR
jgi:nicotinate dehydrogenase subunit A